MYNYIYYKYNIYNTCITFSTVKCYIFAKLKIINRKIYQYAKKYLNLIKKINL